LSREGAKVAKSGRWIEEGFSFGSVGDAGDAVFELGFVEVDQKPEVQRDQSKIVECNFFEEIRDLSDGLEFYQNESAYDEVGAKADVFEKFAIVENRDGLLAFNAVAELGEFLGEGGFVDRFEKSRPEFCVNSEGAIQDRPPDDFVIHSSSLPSLLRETSIPNKDLDRSGVVGVAGVVELGAI
jgi:hypothetical protein